MVNLRINNDEESDSFLGAKGKLANRQNTPRPAATKSQQNANGFSNWWSDFFRPNQATVSGGRRFGAGMEMAPGRPKPAKTTPTEFVGRAGDTMPGRARERTITPTEEAPPEAKVRGFLDFLKEAQGMTAGQGGDGVDYSGLRNDLSSRAATGDANMEAMYRQLQGKYAADAPVVKKNYDDAGAAYTQQADRATGSVDGAANAALSQQAAQFKALGIEGGADGEGIRRDAALSKAHIAEYAQANQGSNTDHAANSAQYNTSMGQVAGLEGAEQRGALQAQLQSRMAELGVQEQESKRSAANNNMNMSMDLASKLQGDYRYELDQQAAANAGPSADMLNAQTRMGKLDFDIRRDAMDRAASEGLQESQQANVARWMLESELKPNNPEYSKLLAQYIAMSKLNP